MTLEGRLEMYRLVHGINDRLLYLDEKSKAKFVKGIDALFKIYPCPREVKYGAEAKLKDGSEANV
jgi:hypothetical protein